MKERLFSSLLVMFVAVVLAAILQELIPPLTPLHLKVPALLGVCVYYSLCRGAGYGFASAVWCGLVQDGLGNHSFGISLLVFCAVAALCSILLKRQLPNNTVSCMLVAMVGGFLTEALQYAALIGSGQYLSLPFLFVLMRLTGFVVIAGLTAGVVSGFVRFLDYVSANAGIENDGESFGWNPN